MTRSVPQLDQLQSDFAQWEKTGDMIDQLMEPDLADRLGCRGAGPEDLTEGTEWLVGFPWAALDQRLDPGAEAEPQWNLFRPKCEALASRFFNPDAAAEEVEFDFEFRVRVSG